MSVGLGATSVEAVCRLDGSRRNPTYVPSEVRAGGPRGLDW